MRIDFKDGGYVEFKPNQSGKYFLTLAATHPQQPNEKIINSVELSDDELKLLLSEVVE